jgi:hypothetical protein
MGVVQVLGGLPAGAGGGSTLMDAQDYTVTALNAGAGAALIPAGSRVTCVNTTGSWSITKNPMTTKTTGYSTSIAVTDDKTLAAFTNSATPYVGVAASSDGWTSYTLPAQSISASLTSISASLAILNMPNGPEPYCVVVCANTTVAAYAMTTAGVLTLTSTLAAPATVRSLAKVSDETLVAAATGYYFFINVHPTTGVLSLGAQVQQPAVSVIGAIDHEHIITWDNYNTQFRGSSLGVQYETTELGLLTPSATTGSSCSATKGTTRGGLPYLCAASPSLTAMSTFNAVFFGVPYGVTVILAPNGKTIHTRGARYADVTGTRTRPFTAAGQGRIYGAGLYNATAFAWDGAGVLSVSPAFDSDQHYGLAYVGGDGETTAKFLASKSAAGYYLHTVDVVAPMRAIAPCPDGAPIIGSIGYALADIPVNASGQVRIAAAESVRYGVGC